LAESQKPNQTKPELGLILELEIEIGLKIGSSSGTRNEPGHGSGTGTRIFENTHFFGGKKFWNCWLTG
jgi:hypothetical protein